MGQLKYLKGIFEKNRLPLSQIKSNYFLTSLFLLIRAKFIITSIPEVEASFKPNLILEKCAIWIIFSLR